MNSIKEFVKGRKCLISPKNLESKLSTLYNLIEQADGDFIFTTSKGVKYSCSFVLASATLIEEVESNVFHIAFTPLDQAKPLNFVNKRIKATISAIVGEFFNQHPEDVLGFICETNDNKQGARFRLFDRWFQQEHFSPTIAKFNFSIPQSKFFMSLMLKSNHVEFDIILEKLNVLRAEAVEEKDTYLSITFTLEDGKD